MLSIFADWIIKVYKSIYFPQDVFSELQKISDAGKDITNSILFETAASVIMTMGISLMLIYFFMDLSEKTAANQMSLKQLSLAFAKLILVAIAMSFSQEIVSGMISFGNALKNTVMDADSSLEECWFDVATVFSFGKAGKNQVLDNTYITKGCLNDLNTMQMVSYVIKLVPPYLIALITDLVFYMIMISRTVELGVRSLFCPIAIADAFNDKRRSTAILYLKKILALSIQFTIAVVIVLLFNAMIKGLSSGIPDPATAFNPELAPKNGTMGSFAGLAKSTWINGQEGAAGAIEWTFIRDGKPVRNVDMKASVYSVIMGSIAGTLKGAWEFIKNSFFNTSFETVVEAHAADKDAMITFLSTLLGGKNYWGFIALSIAKVVMLVKSQTLAKEIIGTS